MAMVPRNHTMSNFLTWLDAWRDKAEASAVGRILTARGFDIAHTGGRSLVWEKTTPTHCCRITVRGLGDEAADPTTVVFDVGLYDADGIWLTENDLTVRGAEAAADWCHKALGAKAAA
jgi:hypothetical protein